ncbi:hypothetical protein V493_01985, partial [Pseudogymnoascus sp. VKM F-4281 (FW-2241)]
MVSTQQTDFANPEIINKTENLQQATYNNHPPPTTLNSSALHLFRALSIKANLLKRLTDINLGRLGVQSQRLSEIRQGLAVVNDACAEEIEWEDSILAVGLPSESGDDRGLADVCADADVVDAGHDEHVVDEEGADALLLKVVCECRVADFEGEDRGVRDVGVAVEVVSAAVGFELDVCLGHLEALEAVDALEDDGLLEADFGGFEALDAHVRLPLDGHGEGLVPEVVGVEVDEGLVGRAVDLLGDVDERHASLGLGHAQRHDRGVRELVLEVHDGVEAVDDSGDGVRARHGRVDGDLDGVGPGVGDVDAIDGQDGAVNLVLDDFGNPDEDAWSRKDNDEDNSARHDQDRPPPLLAEAHAPASLGLLGIAVDVVLDLGLVALAKTHDCS